MIPLLERTKREDVVFARAFVVEGAGEQQPGTYTIETVETLIEELSFLAYRRVSTSIVLPRAGSDGGSYQLLKISPAVVEAAQRV